IALGLNTALVWTAAGRCSLAIRRVDLVDDIHSFGDSPEGREPLGIKAGVVSEVDEYLSRARVRSGGCECDIAALVAFFHLIVGNSRRLPHRGNARIAVNAELHHEAGDYPEESNVRVESAFDQIVEPVCAVRCPVAMDFHDEH